MHLSISGATRRKERSNATPSATNDVAGDARGRRKTATLTTPRFKDSFQSSVGSQPQVTRQDLTELAELCLCRDWHLDHRDTAVEIWMK